MPRLLRLWFGLSIPVDRRTYLTHGAALMALKYAGDFALIGLIGGQSWSPAAYLLPLISLRADSMRAAPQWLWLLVAVWTLPFLWIGVSMTLRRLLDARRSPWLCLLFFVPLMNWILLALLCVL